MPVIQDALAVKNRRYLSNDPLAPVGVVLHSVGTAQPDASVFVKLWQNDRSPYLTHFVVDDQDIFRTMPEDRKCWHVGSPGNSRWLGIELCEPKQLSYTSGAKFTVSDMEAARKFAMDCYHNAVWLIAKLCRTYGWDPFEAVLTHGEVTRRRLSNTTHVDPEHLWNGLGLELSLQTLREDVAAALDFPAKAEPETPPEPETPSQKPEPATAYHLGWEGKWTVTAQSGLNVRSGPGTDRPVLAALPQGKEVRCYGYGGEALDGTIWLYITDHKGIEGYCARPWLKKEW